MDYYQYTITTPDSQREFVLAFLSNLPFDSFTESDTGWEAYVPANEDQDAIQEALKNLPESLNLSFSQTFIPYKNWNAEWEANFQPVYVEDFACVRASFHQPQPQMAHDLVIDPEMAFGTGHHETTWLMIAQMKHIDFKGKSVFDYGCGTGILAILAKQLGALETVAIDIDPKSTENTEKNAIANGVEGIEILTGDLEVVDDNKTFDIILANINRNVILKALPALYVRTKTEGTLLVSGILKSDQEIVLTTAAQAGFQRQKIQQRNNWLCIQFTR